MTKSYLPKIKPLDLVLVVVIISLIFAAILFLYRKTEFINVRVKITDTDPLYARTSPPNWFAGQFHVGDVEYDSIGKVKSKIIAVHRYDISESQYEQNAEAKQVVYLDINTKAVYDTRQKTYQINGQPISFGARIRFLFTNIQFEGLVTDVNVLPHLYTKTTHIVEASLRDPSRSYSETYGVPLFIADAVKTGDKITDSDDNSLVTVIAITKKPALRSIISPSGVTVVTDPLLYDVTYTLEIAAKTVDQSTYFLDTLPLKIGLKLPLNFPNVYIQPIITSIKPVSSQ